MDRRTRTAGRVRVVTLAMIFGLMAAASESLAQGGSWTSKAEMPTARLWHSCSVVDGKIYVIGGVATQGPSLATVEVYDPATDTWERKADMPTPRRSHYTGVVDGKIYAIGGDPSFAVGVTRGVRTVEAYDPVTDTWTSRTNMPTAREAGFASVVDGIIYVMGGVARGGTLLDVVEAYDPGTDTWTTKQRMPHPQHSLSTCEVDGQIYAIGGGRQFAKTVAEYDPGTDTWVKRADMPIGNGYFGAAVVDRQIYTMGGSPGPGSQTSRVMSYDPLADTWTQKPAMPTARFGLCAGVVNGKIYAIGGGRGWPPEAYSTVEEFDPGLATSVEATPAAVPEAFALQKNYPNPFNPATTLRFDVPVPSSVHLAVYDVLGRQVRVLSEGAMPAGRHEAVFAAGDLPSGLYVARLATPEGIFTQTMVLLK